MGQKIGSYKSPLEEKEGAAFVVNTDKNPAPSLGDPGEKGEYRFTSDGIYFHNGAAWQVIPYVAVEQEFKI